MEINLVEQAGTHGGECMCVSFSLLCPSLFRRMLPLDHVYASVYTLFILYRVPAPIHLSRGDVANRIAPFGLQRDESPSSTLP